MLKKALGEERRKKELEFSDSLENRRIKNFETPKKVAWSEEKISKNVDFSL